METPLFRPESPAFRQRAVLVTGLASALVLAAAAWQPFADPSASARIEQARLASEAAESIVAEWEWMLRSPELPIPGAISADVQRGAAWRGPPAAPEPASPRGAARVLLAEADRVELTRNDLREALAIVEEALTKSPTREEVARAHLRGIQLATRLGQAADARRHFEAAVAALDGTELVDGASALALAVLAVGEHEVSDADTSEPGPLRAVACSRLAELSAAGALVLPGADPRLVHDVDHFAFAADPRREAFEEMLAARCASGDAFAVNSRAAALHAIARPRLDEAGLDAWSVDRIDDGLVFVRARADASAHVAVATLEQVERRLVELAAERGVLASGISIDIAGNRDDLGPALRSPIELGDGALSITLRHPDPASIATSARRRAIWLRAGILALAAAIASATLFAHRALVRERRLADLRSRFVANVSHELRTPVASILLMAENLESGRAGAGSTARYHTAIRGEALRLRRLVEDVLDFSRVERGRRIAIDPVDTDLDAWSASLETDLCETAERHGLELAFAASSPLDHAGTSTLGRAAIDAEALRRALLNLVDNAAKHSGSRGVTVAIRAEADAIVLTVRDEGRGIPAARRVEIFEPFARLDDERGAAGAGLGLAIVREIAQAHGGSARAVEPESGAGAQFELRIPRENALMDRDPVNP